MSTFATRTVVCDAASVVDNGRRCNATYVSDATTPSEARHQAERQGWSRGEGYGHLGEDWCPLHRAAREG